jgi:acetyltransferase-like isoleucine patch superfamily enzyme
VRSSGKLLPLWDNRPMRALFNRWRRRLAHALLHRQVFGERSQGRYLARTRISPSSCLEHEERLSLGDHVYIGPFNWIEASGGVTLEEGVQITSHVSIVTHSSHRTMRLMGRAYASEEPQRPGWIAAAVHIGAYSFIGPHVLIEAGSRLGRGCIVRAGSVVRGSFADHAVLDGRPAVVVGDARDGDRAWLERQPRWRPTYAAWALDKGPGQAVPAAASGAAQRDDGSTGDGAPGAPR